MKKVFRFLPYVTLILLSQAALAASGDAQAGKLIYEKKCSKCHGISGDGSGRAGRFLDHKPTPFNDKKKMDAESDEKLAKATKLGSASIGQSKDMEGFPDLSDADIANLVAYIRALAK